MKKIVFVLVVLLFAAPAWARIDITANDVGAGQVDISYVTDGNLPRAFGLDITVDYGVITACTPYMVGECNDFLQGYGIFPGAFGAVITVLPDGTVEDWGVADYTPVSDVEPALDGIDSNGITIELGSLYVGSNWPDASGLLCTITVTENCTVTIEGNAARCGAGSEALGVVMENPDEVPDVNYVAGDVILDCLSVGATIGDIYITETMYALWVSIGKPDIWCCVGNSKGDANDDGFTNASDVGPLIDALNTVTTFATANADLNRDGFVNPSDVGPLIDNLGTDHGGACP